MTLFLASVATLKEVERVAKLMPPHIVDFKTGKFSSWEPLALQTAIDLLPNHLKSAVVGAFDDPTQAGHAMVSFPAGLDYLKIALTNPSVAKINALAHGSGAFSKAQGVLVLFAEQYSHRPTIFTAAKAAGFSVIMLDTLNKPNKPSENKPNKGKNLAEVLSTEQISQFIQEARNNNLKCGLAGGLNTALARRYLRLSIKPDVLGFRGALCTHKRQNLCANKTHQLARLFASQASANAAALRFNAWDATDLPSPPNNDSITDF